MMNERIPVLHGLEDPMCGLDIPAYDLSQEQLSMFSTEQHTENIPVKLELRYAIECRRDDIGPDIDYLQSGEFWNDSNKEASPEEEERRKQRRERNKVAASKCRHKRREHVRNLTKASDELENQNRSLQGEISKLQGEIKSSSSCWILMTVPRIQRNTSTANISYHVDTS